MAFHCREHRLASLTVNRTELIYVAIVVKGLEEPGRCALFDSARLKICRLLGDYHCMKDLFRRVQPSVPQTRAQGLGESAQVNDQTISVQCRKRIRFSTAISKLAVRIVFEYWNAV